MSLVILVYSIERFNSGDVKFKLSHNLRRKNYFRRNKKENIEEKERGGEKKKSLKGKLFVLGSDIRNPAGVHFMNS